LRKSALVGLSLLGLSLLIVGAAVWLSGGVQTELFGVRIRSTTPLKPIGIGAALIAIRLLLHRVNSRLSLAMEAGAARAVARAPVMAASLAVLTTCVALTTNYGVGGGSDSYGYVSQADLWQSGDLTVEHEWLRGAPWPFAALTASPLAYRPAVSGLASVPIYAPGLPLLLAGGKWLFGPFGLAIVIASAAGLLVWTTFVIGRRVASPEVGAAAAWLVATCPVVLFMMASPMSDVPAAAMAALALVGCLNRSKTGAFFAGLATAAVLVIRPNLAPLAAPLGFWLLVCDRQNAAWGPRFARALVFGLGVAPGVIAMALFNRALYGSPTASGYGDLSPFFAASHIASNIRNYSLWLVQTQTPVMAAGLLCLLLPARWLRKTQGVTDRSLLLLMAGGVTALYLPYMVFDRWWYLRFFLPAWPALAIAAAWLLTLADGRSFGRAGVLALLFVGSWSVGFAHTHDAFRVGWRDLRYVSAAHVVREVTPASSVILAMQHSGSVSYYGGRHSLRYDWIEPWRLDSAVTWLREQGRDVYVLVEPWEVDVFRARFKDSTFGALPDTSILVRHEAGTPVLLYDTRPRLVEPRVVTDYVPSAKRWPEPAPLVR
jgi:hypothetical protein